LTIHRTPGPHAVRATQFHSWELLARDLALSPAAMAESCVYSDLVLGPWRGHWVGRELCSQLGVAFPDARQPDARAQAEDATGYEYFGDLTDNEARGDFNTLVAHEAAANIIDALRTRGLRFVVVLAPRGGRTWGSENVQLLDLLVQAEREGGYAVVLVFSGDAEVPAAWTPTWLREDAALDAETAPTVAAVPGILPVAFVAASGPLGADGLTLPDGRVVLSPRLRVYAQADVRGCFAAFADVDVDENLDWLPAYGVADETPSNPEVGAMLASAMERLCEGGHEVARSLLEVAARKATLPPLAAAVLAMRQHMLLRCREFELAAGGPIIDQLPDGLRLALYQSKGWGLAMSGRAQEAEPLLAEARRLLAPQAESRRFLYLLNISALNKLRLGEAAEALALEKTIERALASRPLTDWHATYINSINQARLYKKARDLPTSEAYYARAFDIVAGLRSESDLLYRCLCLAQSAEARGHSDEAYRLWLRTVLHWLSNPVPEALAPRVIEAITQGARHRPDTCVEAVSQRLHAVLAAAAKRAGQTPAEGDPAAPPPCFARIDERVPSQALDAIGAPGWAVLVSAAAPGSSRYAGPAYLALARFVWELLRGSGAVAGLPVSATIFTDSENGHDLPDTKAGLLSLCLRHGVRRYAFDGERAELDDAAATALLGGAELMPSSGLAAVELEGDVPHLRYKRYHAPAPLAPLEVAVLRAAASATTVDAVAAMVDAPRPVFVAALRALEAKRALRVRVREARA
jgi:tetratricopeptide (TPR) repeat protein